jgi:hypothetical protein
MPLSIVGEMKGPSMAVGARERTSLLSAEYFSLVLSGLMSAALVAFYFYSILPYVFLRADILTWAETNFVGDIIKLRIGEPIYTPPEDSNSLVYTPGSVLLTYFISWAIGNSSSIVLWRFIQIGFVASGALVATVCCRILYSLAYPDQRIRFSKTWTVLTFLAMFLVLTAPRVNSFSYTLQTDALALLVSMLNLLMMLFYLRSPNWKRVMLMAVCPAIGYMVKQNMVAWAGVMFIFLLLHDPRGVKQLVLYAIVAGLSIGIAMGVFYLVWGDSFVFWTFEVMGGARKKIGFSASAFNLSVPRSLDHLVRAWMEIGIGMVGGWLLFRGEAMRKLGPLWIAWVALLLNEALTSSVNWGPLYHLGPGVAIGAVWMFGALPRFWPMAIRSDPLSASAMVYGKLRYLMALGGVFTIFVALHVVPTGDKYEARYWKRLPLEDVYRYVLDIEKEFDGLPMDRVLLDIGNWIYLPQSILIKDRAISLADQPPGGIYDNFDSMINRIQNKAYEKILVRDLHSPFFPYDWFSWDRPSGVKKALDEHYTEIRTIPEVKENMSPLFRLMQTGSISVLVPKSISTP